MASSKVMSSNSPSNPDLPRHQSSSSSLHLLPTHQQPTPFSSMNMDDLLKNIYSDSDHFPADPKKSVDEVWKEIVNQPVGGTSAQPAMTLEDFLTKAGAVREEDVKGVEESGGVFGNGGDVMSGGSVIAYPVFGNGGGGGVGRGKRRAVEDPPLDKATQQKQRRMIKNRESAARSRERKQAYTVELESLVTHLEEENARLMQEEVHHEIGFRFQSRTICGIRPSLMHEPVQCFWIPSICHIVSKNWFWYKVGQCVPMQYPAKSKRNVERLF